MGEMVENIKTDHIKRAASGEDEEDMADMIGGRFCMERHIEVECLGARDRRPRLLIGRNPEKRVFTSDRWDSPLTWRMEEGRRAGSHV